MRSRGLWAVALLAALCASAGTSVAESAPGNPASTLFAFAEHLFRAGDYYRAITEYERFIFLHPDDPQRPGAEMAIASSYLLGRQPEAARVRLRSLAEKYAGQEMGRQAAWMLVGSYRMEEEYGRALDEIAAYLKAYPNAPNADAARLAAGLCHLREGSPEAASEAIAPVLSSSSLREEAGGLQEALRRYADLPSKSPKLASALSAIVPGAGQLYVGRRRDAALSFLLNAALIWAAYESFENDENVTGAIITFVEAGWYFGNIYNAANSAHKFNRRTKEDFFRRIDVRYGPVLFDSGNPGILAGASLAF